MCCYYVCYYVLIHGNFFSKHGTFVKMCVILYKAASISHVRGMWKQTYRMRGVHPTVDENNFGEIKRRAREYIIATGDQRFRINLQRRPSYTLRSAEVCQRKNRPLPPSHRSFIESLAWPRGCGYRYLLDQLDHADHGQSRIPLWPWHCACVDSLASNVKSIAPLSRRSVAPTFIRVRSSSPFPSSDCQLYFSSALI